MGNALFLTSSALPGDVVLRVPLERCLVVDYASASGMRLPPGTWPRLQRGVQMDDAAPFDILLALALLDALSGSGDALWERYTNAVLPQPLELTLPLCMPEALLGELQHGAIVAGASQQKQRLAALYPGLAGAACEGGPTWMQWAFACVRSRSFKLRADCFALAPWIDGANHALDPTCDFRLSADGASVELVALKELQDGDEATVSYTGPEGLTNQRMQAQYGFVPSGGNTADRLHFATVAAAPAQSTGGGGGAAALLSLDRLQACLGEGEGMTAALSGADPYAYAVLKSLPLAAEESASGPLDGQIALAQQLMAELGAEAAGWPTSLSDDSALLQAMQEPGGGGDARLASALRYRQQRKLTVRVGMSLLQAFVNLSTAS